MTSFRVFSNHPEPQTKATVRPPVDHSISITQSACDPREPEDHSLFTCRRISPPHVSPLLGGIDPWWRSRLLKPRAVAVRGAPEI
ncbi:hypothetical protein Bca101_068353 [Brassica carinata]